MKLLIFSIIILFLMISSCSETISSNDENSESITIMPLKVGNEWSYHKDSFTTISNGDSLWFEVDSDTIMSKVTLRCIVNYNELLMDIYLYEWWFAEWSHFTELYRNSVLGLEDLGEYDEQQGQFDFESPRLLALYPAEIGDLWSYDDINYECVSKNTTMSVPGGTFSCYEYTQYDIESGEIIGDVYYSTEVGLVGIKKYHGPTVTSNGQIYEVPIEYQTTWERKLLSYSLIE